MQAPRQNTTCLSYRLLAIVKKSGNAMDWRNLAGIIGGGSQVFATATSASILIGAIYTIDCRIMAGTDQQKAMQCWLSGLPMMGLGVAGKAGYNTFNPRLHPESSPKPSAPKAENIDKPERKRNSNGRNDETTKE